MGSMSIMHWAIVLLIILLVFGTKKLTGAGGDLGRAIKNFKDEVNGGENKQSHNNARVIDVTPTENKETK